MNENGLTPFVSPSPYHPIPVISVCCVLSRNISLCNYIKTKLPLSLQTTRFLFSLVLTLLYFS